MPPGRIVDINSLPVEFQNAEGYVAVETSPYRGRQYYHICPLELLNSRRRSTTTLLIGSDLPEDYLEELDSQTFQDRLDTSTFLTDRLYPFFVFHWSPTPSFPSSKWSKNILLSVDNLHSRLFLSESNSTHPHPLALSLDKLHSRLFGSESNSTRGQALATENISAGAPSGQANSLSMAELTQHVRRPEDVNNPPVSGTKPDTDQTELENRDPNKVSTLQEQTAAISIDSDGESSTKVDGGKSSNAEGKKRATVDLTNLDGDSEDEIGNLHLFAPRSTAGKRLPSGVSGKRLPAIPQNNGDNDMENGSSSNNIGTSKSHGLDSAEGSSQVASGTAHLGIIKAKSKPKKKSKSKSKSRRRSFNEYVALSEAKSQSTKVKLARKGKTPSGEIVDEYLFSDVVTLSELSYANLGDMEDYVHPDTEWETQTGGPFYVHILHNDTSGQDEIVPGDYKHFCVYEDYIGPIDGLSEANDMTMITMHERNRHLFELYYPEEVYWDNTYRERFHEDGRCEMRAVHGQFFLVVKTVKQVEDEDDTVTPHSSMLMNKMFYAVNLVEIGPVHNRVVPYDNPYVKTDMMLCLHNANKWAAGAFKAAAKYLLYEQDIQECILKIVEKAEEAEEEMEVPTDFGWEFSHSFISKHRLPEDKGAGMKTVIKVSVQAVETGKY